MNGSVLDTYNPPSVATPANYAIPYVSISYNATGTIATLTITQPTTTAASFGGELTSTGSFGSPDFLINTNTTTAVISGLTPGITYSMRIRAYSSSNQTGTYGDYYYDKVSPPKISSVAGTTSTTSGTQTPPDTEWDEVMTRAKLNQLAAQQAADASTSTDSASSLAEQTYETYDVGTAYAVSGDRDVQTSLFSITNNSIDPKDWSIAVKNTNISTGYKYYTFGTSLFFQSIKQEVSGSGGMGFFISNQGLNGYYVIIQTTSNLSDTADKEVKIYKMVDGNMVLLNDNQSNTSSQLTGILGGQLYKLDVNAIVGTNKVTIEVFINNYKIIATDTTVTDTKKNTEKILPVTSSIAMCSASGKTSFDYVYAMPITEAQYKDGTVNNVYEGKYGIKTLSFAYGDKIISNKTVAADQVSYLEEFGTVARELKKIKVKYEARPASPLYTSTGINKYVSILGQRLTSYGAEIYVINNSGTFVPLDDSDLYSFSVVGNYIVVSGQHEYISNTLNENTIPEPVVFESSWIQSESDAKNLTTWIQEQWSKKQQIVDIEVFSNPIITVGDIISVNYPSNGFDGTQKFVVSKVGNSFSEGGLSTTITARSIYS
jgi:hypothetical protein